jgi:hypothetical protein
LHRYPHGTGFDRIVLNIVVRTVKRELNILAPDRSCARVLAYMKACPQVEGPPPLRVELKVERTHGFLRLCFAPGFIAEGSASHILSELHRVHFHYTREEYPGSPLIHGGTLSTNRGHIVFVGDRGAGKTTLLFHLASLGWPVAADEHVVIDGEMAIPRPRSLRVKSGALPYLSPRASELVRASPSTPDWEGSLIYAVEPTVFGQPWLIRRSPLLHLVMLRANHGGRSKIRELDRDSALELLLPNVILPDTQKATALAWLRSATGSAKCWELWNGRLDDAQDIIYRAFIDG